MDGSCGAYDVQVAASNFYRLPTAMYQPLSPDRCQYLLLLAFNSFSLGGLYPVKAAMNQLLFSLLVSSAIYAVKMVKPL